MGVSGCEATIIDISEEILFLQFSYKNIGKRLAKNFKITCELQIDSIKQQLTLKEHLDVSPDEENYISTNIRTKPPKHRIIIKLTYKYVDAGNNQEYRQRFDYIATFKNGILEWNSYRPTIQ